MLNFVETKGKTNDKNRTAMNTTTSNNWQQTKPTANRAAHTRAQERQQQRNQQSAELDALLRKASRHTQEAQELKDRAKAAQEAAKHAQHYRLQAKAAALLATAKAHAADRRAKAAQKEEQSYYRRAEADRQARLSTDRAKGARSLLRRSQHGRNEEDKNLRTRVIATSHLTGEIRTYLLLDDEPATQAANLDYLGYGQEETTYRIETRSEASYGCWQLQTEKHHTPRWN